MKEYKEAIVNGDKTEQQPNVEEEVQAQSEAEEVLEDLSGVEPCLNDGQLAIIFAQERFKLAVNYQVSYIQAVNIRASVVANEAVGNSKVVEDYRSKLELIDRDLKHLLRGIKEIDKACPEAKQKMKEMQASGNRK